MISAKVVADSINPWGNRITTMVVTFPRIILAEFNTHRMFSRNTSSSRAIPASKMIEAVETNPFIPLAWQKQHKGMQGYEYIIDSHAIMIRKAQWLMARDNAVKVAKDLNSTIKGKDGEPVSKQIINRLLEPFMWTTVIVTATEWDNFFELRCPKYVVNYYPNNRSEALEPTQATFKSRRKAACIAPDDAPALGDDFAWYSLNESTAEIHIQALAEAMWDALDSSIPKKLLEGEWHIPFDDKIDFEKDIFLNPQELKLKVATAMCARVSYTVVGDADKKTSYEKDIELHDLLLKEGHMSPFEHCAKVPKSIICDDFYPWEHGYTYRHIYGDMFSGNFKNWIQYRQTI